ncbi:MAG: outer rane immunogenic protein [Hyphomicrobiales bacterium]|nr:outer rane immunogenic protein [Hyphomicrobiales bacterium]
MKKFLLGVLALTSLSGAQAVAADMPVKAMRMSTPVAYSWTGCFIGVAGGGVWGRSRHISGDPGTVGLDITNRYDVNGAIVGVEYGCNYQSGMWVFGTESDFSWTNARGSAFNIAPFNTASISGTREHWLSTTRLRAGILASPQMLLYVTGGLATARVEATVDATAVGGGFVSESKTRWGWTAGAGAEFALGGNWSAKADYLYVRLNNKDYLNPAPLGFAIRGNVPLDEHVFRVGLNYKFSNCFFILLGCDAVVAKY